MHWDKLIILFFAIVVILHWMGYIDIPDSVAYFIIGAAIIAYWVWQIVV
jgi:hypothetical protein